MTTMPLTQPELSGNTLLEIVTERSPEQHPSLSDNNHVPGQRRFSRMRRRMASTPNQSVRGREDPHGQLQENPVTPRAYQPAPTYDWRETVEDSLGATFRTTRLCGTIEGTTFPNPNPPLDTVINQFNLVPVYYGEPAILLSSGPPDIR